jgi:hypothetical protein
MNTIELETKFFTGGNATFTVDNGQGTHYTFKIRQPKSCDKFFAMLLTGPDNEHSYTYMGVFEPIFGGIRLTAKSRYNDDSQPVKVLRWAMKHAFGDKLLPDGYAIHHEGKCGCCGRTLTVPESIKRGIGPECWSRICGA